MKEVSRTRNAWRYLAGAASVGALFVAGCGEDTKAINSFGSSCTPENARPLPLGTDMFKVKDDRRGSIYSCNYLLDMRIPFNRPTRLLKAVENNVESSDFKMSGSLGGFALLGTGVLSGDFKVSSKVQQERVTALRFEDSDQAIRTILVDTDKTRIKACPETKCEPTVTFDVSEEPLWVKKTARDYGNQGEDNSSIWLYEEYGEYNNDSDRQRILAMLALKGPHDEKRKYENGITGGPDTVSNVVSVLAESITLELPRSAVE
jgi:hypothetical protein